MNIFSEGSTTKVEINFYIKTIHRNNGARGMNGFEDGGTVENIQQH